MVWHSVDQCEPTICRALNTEKDRGSEPLPRSECQSTVTTSDSNLQLFISQCAFIALTYFPLFQVCERTEDVNREVKNNPV